MKITTLRKIKSFSRVDNSKSKWYNSNRKEIKSMAKKNIDKEALIDKIMAECAKDGEPVTREEAEEIAEMEIKSGNISNYTISEEKKKVIRKPREKKVDDEKAKIIEIIGKALTDNGYNAIITNVDREITINNMTLVLTKHKKKG